VIIWIALDFNCYKFIKTTGYRNYVLTGGSIYPYNELVPDLNRLHRSGYLAFNLKGKGYGLFI